MMFTYLKPKSQEEIEEALLRLPFRELHYMYEWGDIDYDALVCIIKNKKFNVASSNNLLIQWAAINNNLELVEYLLKDRRVDPSAAGNYARFIAHNKGYKEMEKLLATDERTTNWQGIFEEYYATH